MTQAAGASPAAKQATRLTPNVYLQTCHSRCSAACNIKDIKTEQGPSCSSVCELWLYKAVKASRQCEVIQRSPLASDEWKENCMVPLDAIKAGMNCPFPAHEHTVSSTMLQTLWRGSLQPVSSSRCSPVSAQVGHRSPPPLHWLWR